MARATLAALITQIRVLIDDSGNAPVWSDDQIQVALDAQRADVRYVPLTAIKTRQPGGTTLYLEYHAGTGWWEDTVTLVNGSYESLTPATSDLARGVWTFAADTRPPVLVSGSYYDLYATAVDLLTAWLAKLKLVGYDFTADGASFKRSQQVAAVQALIARYQAQSGSGGLVRGEMWRGDVNARGW